MITKKEFSYQPQEHEAEKASNAYLMSVIFIIAGLPFPIVNLIGTFIFFLGNLKGTQFVRWHCTHALLSQVTVLFMNSACLYWTLSIVFGDKVVTNMYIGYVITIVAFNIAELIATFHAASSTREGKHVEWWFFGPLTNLIFKIEEK